MKKYQVRITEKLSRDVFVIADSGEDALTRVKKQYFLGCIALNNNDLCDATIEVQTVKEEENANN